MAIDQEKLAELMTLSRLHIGEESSAEFKQDLTNILGLLEELKLTDTKGVEPLTNPHDASQFLRTDSVTEDNQRESLIKNAPESESGLYLVPQ
ncbi:MAG: Asp-tRNA(Asn)/Glu-tRNA(Gln) amidotransferase subunit GatC, partial [Candidatus Portiera sp.]|nr:Asp-tRNA(Asn)/Glu-tRNA(Gln) amidotransferase subunit GatC [Portiera sp.]